MKREDGFRERDSAYIDFEWKQRGVNANWLAPYRSVAEAYADVLLTRAYYGRTPPPRGYYDHRLDDVRTL